eukprot:g4013.t1
MVPGTKSDEESATQMGLRSFFCLTALFALIEDTYSTSTLASQEQVPIIPITNVMPPAYTDTKVMAGERGTEEEYNARQERLYGIHSPMRMRATGGELSLGGGARFERSATPAEVEIAKRLSGEMTEASLLLRTKQVQDNLDRKEFIKECELLNHAMTKRVKELAVFAAQIKRAKAFDNSIATEVLSSADDLSTKITASDKDLRAAAQKSRSDSAWATKSLSKLQSETAGVATVSNVLATLSGEAVSRLSVLLNAVATNINSRAANDPDKPVHTPEERKEYMKAVSKPLEMGLLGTFDVWKDWSDASAEEREALLEEATRQGARILSNLHEHCLDMVKMYDLRKATMSKRMMALNNGWEAADRVIASHDAEQSIQVLIAEASGAPLPLGSDEKKSDETVNVDEAVQTGSADVALIFPGQNSISTSAKNNAIENLKKYLRNSFQQLQGGVRIGSAVPSKSKTFRFKSMQNVQADDDDNSDNLVAYFTIETERNATKESVRAVVEQNLLASEESKPNEFGKPSIDIVKVQQAENADDNLADFGPSMKCSGKAAPKCDPGTDATPAVAELCTLEMGCKFTPQLKEDVAFRCLPLNMNVHLAAIESCSLKPDVSNLSEAEKKTVCRFKAGNSESCNPQYCVYQPPSDAPGFIEEFAKVPFDCTLRGMTHPEECTEANGCRAFPGKKAHRAMCEPLSKLPICSAFGKDKEKCESVNGCKMILDSTSDDDEVNMGSGSAERVTKLDRDENDTLALNVKDVAGFGEFPPPSRKAEVEAKQKTIMEYVKMQEEEAYRAQDAAKKHLQADTSLVSKLKNRIQNARDALEQKKKDLADAKESEDKIRKVRLEKNEAFINASKSVLQQLSAEASYNTVDISKEPSGVSEAWNLYQASLKQKDTAFEDWKSAVAAKEIAEENVKEAKKKLEFWTQEASKTHAILTQVDESDVDKYQQAKREDEHATKKKTEFENHCIRGMNEDASSDEPCQGGGTAKEELKKRGDDAMFKKDIYDQKMKRSDELKLIWEKLKEIADAKAKDAASPPETDVVAQQNENRFKQMGDEKQKVDYAANLLREVAAANLRASTEHEVAQAHLRDQEKAVAELNDSISKDTIQLERAEKRLQEEKKKRSAVDKRWNDVLDFTATVRDFAHSLDEPATPIPVGASHEEKVKRLENEISSEKAKHKKLLEQSKEVINSFDKVKASVEAEGILLPEDETTNVSVEFTMTETDTCPRNNSFLKLKAFILSRVDAAQEPVEFKCDDTFEDESEDEVDRFMQVKDGKQALKGRNHHPRLTCTFAVLPVDDFNPSTLGSAVLIDIQNSSVPPGFKYTGKFPEVDHSPEEDMMTGGTGATGGTGEEVTHLLERYLDEADGMSVTIEAVSSAAEESLKKLKATANNFGPNFAGANARVRVVFDGSPPFSKSDESEGKYAELADYIEETISLSLKGGTANNFNFLADSSSSLPIEPSCRAPDEKSEKGKLILQNLKKCALDSADSCNKTYCELKATAATCASYNGDKKECLSAGCQYEASFENVATKKITLEECKKSDASKEQCESAGCEYEESSLNGAVCVPPQSEYLTKGKCEGTVSKRNKCVARDTSKCTVEKATPPVKTEKGHCENEYCEYLSGTPPAIAADFVVTFNHDFEKAPSDEDLFQDLDACFRSAQELHGGITPPNGYKVPKVTFVSQKFKVPPGGRVMLKPIPTKTEIRAKDENEAAIDADVKKKMVEQKRILFEKAKKNEDNISQSLFEAQINSAISKAQGRKDENEDDTDIIVYGQDCKFNDAQRKFVEIQIEEALKVTANLRGGEAVPKPPTLDPQGCLGGGELHLRTSRARREHREAQKDSDHSEHVLSNVERQQSKRK